MKPINLDSLIRENVKRLKPYSSARDEFQGSASVFLDANENPFDSGYNRYPDPHQVLLKQRIAEIKKVTPQQLFLGNGSDEAIDLLIRAFCEPGRDNVLIPQPTYGMYSISAQVNNIESKAVQLTEDFDLDLNAFQNSWNEHTKLLFLCSPNNPSGNSLNFEKVKDLIARFPGLVVIDEAYIDFAGYSGFLPLLGEFGNLVVLQTFSKAWGLAGIRLGMCFSSPEIIRVLDKIKPPYNINTMTQQVAMDYLSKETRKDSWVDDILKARGLLMSGLAHLPVVLKVYPSDANFVLVKVTDARKVYSHLLQRGIIVRDRSNVILCENGLRITVGTADETKQLLEALKQY
jgi:histidinol-phosphate aminotransferase